MSYSSDEIMHVEGGLGILPEDKAADRAELRESLLHPRVAHRRMSLALQLSIHITRMAAILGGDAEGALLDSTGLLVARPR